ncbi:hypothetical protein D018_1988B, partial [Vibrio parahaemolyticus VP2007-007]
THIKRTVNQKHHTRCEVRQRILQRETNDHTGNTETSQDWR